MSSYTISTDKARLEIDVIQDFLNHSSYWAQDRPLATIEKSLQNSLCFGVYDGERQVGFARVVTDYATFAWLADVFVLETHRGQGIGKQLIEHIVAHPDLQNIRLFCLATRDAHGLYQAYGGFEVLDQPELWMLRRRDEKPTANNR
jgi:GNAT superfamily N-acetyltransferase